MEKQWNNRSYSIAVIMSCYNRRDYSIRCINSIMEASKEIPGLSLFFYVWDDGSTDGTADALDSLSQDIRVFRGPGNYFWSKSMHFAMKEAGKSDHDLFLMVNDDACFYKTAFNTLLDDYRHTGGRCGIVGSTEFEGMFTYGGHDRKYDAILPEGKPVTCRYANWNCFMIDRFVLDKIGPISEKYEHAGGDYDYSARMVRVGIPMYVASGYVAECECDHKIPQYFNPDKSISQRFKFFFSPKGEPFYSFFMFHWVDKRFKGLIIAVISYVKLIFKIIFLKDQKCPEDDQ